MDDEEMTPDQQAAALIEEARQIFGEEAANQLRDKLADELA